MNINELSIKEKSVTVKGTIIDISTVKTFARFGNPGKIAVAVLKDETGKIDLTLWDEEADKFKVGDEVVVEDGKVKEFRGVKQISAGTKGSIKKV